MRESNSRSWDCSDGNLPKIIVWRWWYFLGIAGIVLTVWGGAETRHATASGSEPADVAVADLQRGAAGPQPWVRLGEHLAPYSVAGTPRTGRRDNVGSSRPKPQPLSSRRGYFQFSHSSYAAASSAFLAASLACSSFILLALA